MINFQSFKVSDYKAANEFLKTHPIKGEMKFHDGYICVFYEVDEPENKSNRIQYLRGMAEAHFKKQWEYEEQMRMGILLRDLFDKNEKRGKDGKPTSWENGNANVVSMAKMLEMEILTTKIIIGMLAKLGVVIEQPEVEMPKVEMSPNQITMEELANKMNKDADKKGKA